MSTVQVMQGESGLLVQCSLCTAVPKYEARRKRVRGLEAKYSTRRSRVLYLPLAHALVQYFT